MNKPFKVLFAYDGSKCSDLAIDDLPRAGLPATGEARVVSVADITKTAIANPDELSVLSKFVSVRLLEETIKLTEKETARIVNETKNLAARGSRLFMANLPGWSVSEVIPVGEAAEEIRRASGAWKPDLIIIGSHGRGAIGRFLLGSVSKIVAEEAACAVRVARRRSEKPDASPNKIIVGAGTLTDAGKLFRAVGARSWSDNTEIRLIKVDDGVSRGRISAVYPYAGAIFEESMNELRDAGLEVSALIKSGDLKSILLETAKIWEADSIFVVAGADKAAGLNETAAALITNAVCTVEIVR